MVPVWLVGLPSHFDEVEPRRLWSLPSRIRSGGGEGGIGVGDRISYVPAWGNLFVPTDLADNSRTRLLGDAKTRRRLLAALYDQFEDAYKANHLVCMIRQHRPEVVVDCVNTATGVSYQDVFDGAAKVREWIGDDGFESKGVPDLEAFLLSQSSPQIIRHVRFVHRATTDYRMFLKVGTTGTGGMGLNIPYTHSEDKPSKKLLAKNEAAFGHTGAIPLARTPNAPIVKEIKPAAMIGYRGVQIAKPKTSMEIRISAKRDFD